MTPEEIEQQARDGWNAMGEEHPSISHVKSMCWQYYLKAWQDACKVLYTEEDMKACWQQGYGNGLLYDMDEDITGPKPDYSEWIEQLKQAKQQ